MKLKWLTIGTNTLVVLILIHIFVILGILVSFEIVCTAPDSEMVGSVENDKFELYTTNIFSVSGRDFLSLPKEMRTLKVCCETI